MIHWLIGFSTGGLQEFVTLFETGHLMKQVEAGSTNQPDLRQNRACDHLKGEYGH